VGQEGGRQIEGGRGDERERYKGWRDESRRKRRLMTGLFLFTYLLGHGEGGGHILEDD
jgi:hypothetical protein